MYGAYTNAGVQISQNCTCLHQKAENVVLLPCHACPRKDGHMSTNKNIECISKK
jgi:hypothetical protein